MIGIYKITNKINNKCYIGQSTNIERRWAEHQNKYHKYPDRALYRAFNKYGLENFIFEIIEECEDTQLNDKEKYWIQYYNSYHNGYNLTLGGDGVLGQGGENSPSHILFQKEADIIISMLKNDCAYKDIQKKVPKATISMITDINNGKSWKREDQSYPIRKRPGNERFSEQEVIEIITKYNNGISKNKLSKEYNCCWQTIDRLIRGETYSYLFKGGNNVL